MKHLKRGFPPDTLLAPGSFAAGSLPTIFSSFAQKVRSLLLAAVLLASITGGLLFGAGAASGAGEVEVRVDQAVVGVQEGEFGIVTLHIGGFPGDGPPRLLIDSSGNTTAEAGCADKPEGTWVCEVSARPGSHSVSVLDPEGTSLGSADFTIMEKVVWGSSNFTSCSDGCGVVGAAAPAPGGPSPLIPLLSATGLLMLGGTLIWVARRSAKSVR